ncbi:MAG TPA: sigma-70 family RNA polymerase sigma factor [Dehalococcoidia bacterium]|nr:sigma-70 family RNA polymerase sigma factor [Dehalococcoidia bacterium]
MQQKVARETPDVSPLLVRRAVRRDRAAFAELYNIYRPGIVRYVRNHVGSGLEAEDIAGRVFLKAWQAIDRYQDRGRPFSSWLYRLAHNQVVDHHRTRHPTAPLLDFGLFVTPDTAFETVRRKHAAEEISEAMQVLTADQRQVIQHKFADGLDNPTIARLMKKKEGAVRALQMRGLSALRRELEQRWQAEVA